MKVVILAGGLGTRLAEETDTKPKPAVRIGGQPILWHIMKHYAHYGFREFFIALGYKGEILKKYFRDKYRPKKAVTDSGNLKLELNESGDSWEVNLIDTGLHTETGGRLKRLEPWLGEEKFMLTYGDGVSNVDLKALADFHHEHDKMVTLTAVHPPSRFGVLSFDQDTVIDFSEKPQVGEGWINGGYLIFNPEIFRKFEGEDKSLESVTLSKLAQEGELKAYRHHDFWRCMDTPRDLRLLESLWKSNEAPWRIWDRELSQK
jgi:glucose-1-phosphate cytidylyltransferase